MSEFIKAAVIGHPIAHSKSPLIHTHWIEKYGRTGSYEAIDITPENLERDIRNMVEQGYRGFNVTVPHKESVYALCDDLDSAAKKIGAANTIVIENESLIGKNTDAFGFVTNILDNIPGFQFDAESAFILGAGGAAKAAIYGLIEQGCPHIYLSNRTQERAESLAGLYPDKITVVPWGETEPLAEVNFLSNTTSLGMSGKPPLEIDLSALNPEAIVNDIVYAPLETDLLRAAKERGNTTVTGIGMLLQQARPAFESWFGVMPDVLGDEELMRKALS